MTELPPFSDQDFIQSLQKMQPPPPFDSASILKLFHGYNDLLSRWNKNMNLMSEGDLPRIWSRHFLDSAMAVEFLKGQGEKNFSLIDIGTGAGLPGIPIKIIFPDLRVSLLDSNQKRCKFLLEVVAALGLQNMEVLGDRAEAVSKNTMKRETYHFAVTRALSNPNSALELLLPFLKVGGIALFWGAAKDWEPKERVNKVANALGGRYQTHKDYSLPGDEPERLRRITVIEKIQKTPVQYPRAIGIAQKKPLS